MIGGVDGRDRKWESVAQEWVEPVPFSEREDGTVLVRYLSDGKVLRVGSWILQRSEDD